jgi:hypothetical protein
MMQNDSKNRFKVFVMKYQLQTITSRVNDGKIALKEKM